VIRTPTVLLLAAAVIFAESAGANAMQSGASFPQPGSWPVISSAEHAGEAIGPGVNYDRWQLRTGIGPLTVHITTIDLRNPYVSLAVGLHHDNVVGPDEPLSAMADRAHAEAAINGDYFDINESGAPLNVVAVAGRFLHQPDGAAALVVGSDGSASMGPVTLQVTIADATGARLSIASINDWSKENGLSLLTPEFGVNNLGADLEVVLTPAATAGSYRVAAVGQSVAQLLPLGPADLAIVARGAESVGRAIAFASNDVVSVTFDGSPPPASISFALGGGPLLLRDGKPVVDPVVPAAQETDVRYPVTGAGLSADGSTLWLVAVDGRAPGRSVGITRPMLRSLLLSLGAAQAMALDSGGSTEMAVRDLGEATISVANAPSDGRERSIADSLLVVNKATPGPASQLLLIASAPAVLVGSHVRLRPSAIDANMQPVALDPASVRFDVPSCCASIDASGTLAAASPGAATVVARSGDVSSVPLLLTVVSRVDALAIDGYARDVAAGSKLRLTIDATTSDGQSIGIDPAAVSWAATGDGRVGADGTFVGGPAPGIAMVVAQTGGARASLRVLVGEHPVALAAGDWRFGSSPATVGGSVDRLAAPDGSPGLHLDFDFSQGGATRAAYANTQLPMAGEPLAVSVDVYGDGGGEWLRGAYRNADGVVDSITLARRVDWTGWKTIRVALPVEARMPIVWTRFYAVETRHDALETGDLWFRNFTASYAGPASPGP